MSDYAIKFENVSKYYKLYDSPRDRLKEALHPMGKKYHREFFALKNISLEIKKGEIVGIIGRNGSGKSTLLKTVAGVIPPNSGNIGIQGTISALLDLGAGMNPNFSGVQNIHFGGIMMGFSPEEMNEKMPGIISFAGIGDFIHQPLKTYSSGMKARLGFALAISIKPEILIVDEVLAVGDDFFRKKCYDKMNELMHSGCTVLFVSHNTQTVDQLCSRAILLDGGELILEGPSPFVSRYYLRLLYTPADRQEALRNEIIRLNANQEEKANYILRDAAPPAPPPPPPPTPTVSSAPPTPVISPTPPVPPAPLAPPTPAVDPAKPVAYLIPNFNPITTIKHEFEKINIRNIAISTLSGQRVNALVMDEEYILSYYAEFSINAEKVKFHAWFQNKKSVDISGFSIPLEEPQTVKIGDTWFVQIRFKCLLLPGNHFVNLSITRTGEEGEKIRLYIIHDAAVFKVLENREKRHWGFVNLEQHGSLQKIG